MSIPVCVIGGASTVGLSGAGQQVSGSARPVTVRSVKRRDKAKTEEKRIMQQTHSNPGTPRVNLRNEDNAAVMVWARLSKKITMLSTDYATFCSILKNGMMQWCWRSPHQSSDSWTNKKSCSIWRLYVDKNYTHTKEALILKPENLILHNVVVLKWIPLRYLLLCNFVYPVIAYS